jgi:hypothetical protein
VIGIVDFKYMVVGLQLDYGHDGFMKGRVVLRQC